MEKITFCEAYAGTGAVTLSLFGKQPYPLRTGHKTKLANEICKRMGLSKDNLEKVIFCELDPHVRLLLKSYSDKELHVKTKEILMSYVDRAENDPYGLWFDCMCQVKEERKTLILDEYSLSNWISYAIWEITKGCYFAGYCGPGKVTKSGNVPGFVNFRNAINRLPFVEADIEFEVVKSCYLAKGDIIYLDPPYNLSKNDNLYGSNNFGENSNVSTACDLAEKLKESSKVYLSTSCQMYTLQEPIGVQSRVGKERTEWFGLVD